MHHIKKENIGLIEVMGLAVLPGRLKEEMDIIGYCIVSENAAEKIAANPMVEKHLDWALNIQKKHPELSSNNVNDILQTELGAVFLTILNHAGVFKRTKAGKEAFHRFIDDLNKQN